MDIELTMKYNKYRNNKDFRNYVDKCSNTYNKSVEEILKSNITEQYYMYIIEKEKNQNENK